MKARFSTETTKTNVSTEEAIAQHRRSAPSSFSSSSSSSSCAAVHPVLPKLAWKKQFKSRRRTSSSCASLSSLVSSTSSSSLPSSSLSSPSSLLRSPSASSNNDSSSASSSPSLPQRSLSASVSDPLPSSVKSQLPPQPQAQPQQQQRLVHFSPKTTATTPSTTTPTPMPFNNDSRSTLASSTSSTASTSTKQATAATAATEWKWRQEVFVTKLTARPTAADKENLFHNNSNSRPTTSTATSMTMMAKPVIRYQVLSGSCLSNNDNSGNTGARARGTGGRLAVRMVPSGQVFAGGFEEAAARTAVKKQKVDNNGHGHNNQVEAGALRLMRGEAETTVKVENDAETDVEQEDDENPGAAQGANPSGSSFQPLMEANNDKTTSNQQTQNRKRPRQSATAAATTTSSMALEVTPSSGNTLVQKRIRFKARPAGQVQSGPAVKPALLYVF